MIKHIVCFKLKDHAEGASKAENARRIKQEVEALKAKVPGAVKVEVGINIVEDPMAYDLVVNSEFTSPEALQAYAQHPDHLKIVQFIGKVREARVVVDYEG